MLISQIVYFFTGVVSLANSARILGVFQMPSYSHYQLGHTLLKELAAKGHEVTVITPSKEKEKVQNLRTIVITDSKKHFESLKMNMFNFANFNMLSSILNSDIAFLPLVEGTLNDTDVQNLIKSNEKFDVVIIERLFNDAFHGFCAHFEAHCVISCPLSTSSWLNNQMGNSGSPSYVPEIHSRFTPNMNFFERAYNFLGYIVSTFWFYAYTIHTHNAIMQKYFPNLPHLHDIYYNVSLSLINSHVSTNPAYPLLPNMIEIGGYHIQPPKALPKDLKDYLDDAKEGVIYFNLGSNLQSQDLDNAKRNAILKAFAGLKQRVLWKWETESLPNQPPNVKLLKWLPQNDLLAHPNVKLFITHGGLLSSLEAIYHGVPIVGIPVYGDQYSNMRNAEENGYGIGIPYSEFTEEKFLHAIEEVLYNPKYSKTAKLRSKLLHDNQIKLLDKAVFWIEYIMRNKGAPHLRTAALNLTWYQYLLLDVVAFVAFLIVLPISACCCLCMKGKSTKSTQMKKSKKIQ